MAALSEFVLRHKMPVVLFWIAVFACGVFASSEVGDRLSQEFSFPGEPGYVANVDILKKYGNGGPGNPLVSVVTLPEGKSIESPGVSEALGQTLDQFAQESGSRVVSYANTGDRGLVADGGRTTFALVMVPYYGEEGMNSRVGNAIETNLENRLPAGTEVRVTGLDVLASQSGGSEEEAGVLVETLVGALGALFVLAFVFGSFLALAPLVVAAVSIIGAFLAIYGLTWLAEINFLVQFLVSLIGLGVAIDYSLLLVTRWREERSRGHDKEEAVRRAMATAGRAVVLSGGTVAVGLLVLVFLPVPFLRSVGYGAILIPLVATLVTLTLLPVLLATVGPRLDWPGLRTDATAGRAWTYWAGVVAGHPWLATLAALAIIVPLCVAAAGIRMGTPTAESLAGASAGPAREGLTTLKASGLPGGVLTPIEVLVPAETSPERVAERLEGVDGVYTVVAPEGQGWRRDGTGLVSVLPAAQSGTAAGKETVERVRGVMKSEFPGSRVGGSGALLIDSTSAIYGSFPLVLAAIGTATFILLARAFRSLVLAAQAVLMNLLSIGAAYGALVLVWQHGYGSEAIWGIDATGAITAWVPLMTFAFLFGLSMDYEVFLLSRMREEYDDTGSTHKAVVEGLGRIGRLVTSAALILFLAFVALASVPETDVKIMATGLGAGILLDATVLRALLVPALISLCGKWTWWLPSRTARLLRVPPSIHTATKDEPR
ncbi:MAG TPA: MMPL family transporter [Rubrobacter sp.]